MIYFFQVQVSILFYYCISHPNIGLHRSIWVFLLHEVDTDRPFPFIRASLVQPIEVDLLGVDLESEEYEAGRKVRVCLSHFEVCLIEGLHIHLFIMNLDKGAVLIVFSQLTKQGPKLYTIITTLDVFQQNVLDILLEDV